MQPNNGAESAWTWNIDEKLRVFQSSPQIVAFRVFFFPSYFIFIFFKNPCIKQVFDQDSSPQSLLPPLLFRFSNPLDGDFICGPLRKQKNEKLITKGECKRHIHGNILIWRRYQLIPPSPRSFLPSFLRLNRRLWDFFLIIIISLSVSLSCLSFWLTASPVCQPHTVKNVLVVLPAGIYLKLSFLLNLGRSRKRSAELNMTNKLQIFVSRPYVLLLSYLWLAENIHSCSPSYC